MKPKQLTILEALAAGPATVGFSDLQKRTHISPATLNRLLHKLIEGDYVRKVGHGAYEVGPALLALSTLVSENSVALPFRPLLHSLAEETGLLAAVYAMTPPGPVFLLQAPGRNDLRLDRVPGTCDHVVEDHPTEPFYFLRYPEAYAWRNNLWRNRDLDPGNIRSRADRAQARLFHVSRGAPRPELASVAMPTSDFGFAIVLTGWLSDIPERADASLHIVMQRVLRRFDRPNALNPHAVV